MAEILVVTRGMASIVYPSVELARRLAVAGHRVTFAGSPEDRELVEGQDIPGGQALAFLPLAPSRYEDFLAEDAHTGLLARLLRLRQRRHQARDAMRVDGFARNLQAMTPDLILLDGEMHEHILTALGVGRATGARIVLLNMFASIWRRPGVPPPHCLVRPGVGWKGTRVGMAALWLALRIHKWRRAVHLRLRRVGCDRLSVLRLVARDAGLDLRRETDASQWLIPFTYRHLPVLSLHALDFELPHRPPPRVRYVGPMVLESRRDRSMEPAAHATLEAIFERRRNAGTRLIYAGFGSALSADRELLRRLVEAVARNPEWELVVSLSGRSAASELGPLPARAHVFSWVPQTRVLEHADVAVTHGGINTLDECVLHGVPVLVYCGFETDMAGNAARVAHHGLGIVGDPDDGAARIHGHLERLLDEPSYPANVESLRRRYVAYGEEHVLERCVETLLEQGGFEEST